MVILDFGQGFEEADNTEFFVDGFDFLVFFISEIIVAALADF